jgi:hypothetical protein
VQLAQAEALAAEYVPRPQRAHVDEETAPAVGEKVPAGQTAHVLTTLRTE